MLDGDSPFVRIDATSSKPGNRPEDALYQEGVQTCWEPDMNAPVDEIDSLTVTILSEGEALVTYIVMTVKWVSMVEIEYLPSSFTPVSIFDLLIFSEWLNMLSFGLPFGTYKD